MAQTSEEELEQTGPVEKERVVSVPQNKQLAARAAFAKRERNRAISPDYQIVRW